MRQAIFRGNAAGLLISNSGVVDHCVQRTKAIDLLGHIAGLCNAGQIADEHAGGDWTVISCPVIEGGSGLFGVDPAGEKRWGGEKRRDAAWRISPSG